MQAGSDDHGEIRALAAIAHGFCKAAMRPIENNDFSFLTPRDILETMRERHQDQLARLWDILNHQAIPGTPAIQDSTGLSEAMLNARPRESFRLMEIMADALMQNVTPGYLRRHIRDKESAQAQSSRFLMNAAPNLATIFDLNTP